jgi:hypothetical protein
MVEMSDCTIVLSVKEAEAINQVVEAMKAAGITINDVDTDDGVIECTAPESVLVPWETHHMVEYIRRNFTYLKP